MTSATGAAPGAKRALSLNAQGKRAAPGIFTRIEESAEDSDCPDLIAVPDSDDEEADDDDSAAADIIAPVDHKARLKALSPTLTERELVGLERIALQASRRKAPAELSPNSKARAKSQCAACKAHGFPVEHYTGHRKDNKDHCDLCYRFKDHAGTCVRFGVPVEAAGPLDGLISPDNGLAYCFWTMVKTGRDIPGIWWEQINDWFKEFVNTDIGEEYFGVLERGGKEVHLHAHFCSTHRIPNTPQARKKLIVALKAHLSVTANDGTKFQNVARDTASAHLNTKKYICKQVEQPWFKMASSNNYMTLDTVKEYCKQYGETQNSEWEKQMNILKPVELLSWFASNREAHKLPAAGIGDCILWAVQTGDIRLSMSFVTPKGGAKWDAEVTARFAKVMQDPAGATPRDVYCVLFGSLDPATRGKVNRFYYGDAGIDLESVRDAMVFVPQFYGRTRLEAQQSEHLAPTQFNEANAEFRINFDDLYPWQKKVVGMLDVRENAKFGRTVHWLWESTGNVGKSILASYLVDNCGAIEVGGNSHDALFAITEFCKIHGEGPRVIIFDLARSHSGLDYETIEKAKDGKFFSGKYGAASVRFARPHVICFSNEEPDLEKLSRDRYNVVHLGVDLPLDR
jgi:hypothetical protein